VLHLSNPTPWSRPIFARLYRQAAARADDRGAREHRRELVAGLSGRVLELGVGTGLTFRHYPATVRHVVAVEPERRLRASAAAEAAHASARVDVVRGRAEDLPASDATVDAVVAVLVLCSIDDLETALREVRRVLRPGGRFRFYEHVRAATAAGALAQRSLARAWPPVVGGCHAARDTLSFIEGAGFEIVAGRDFRFRPTRFAPRVPYVIGEARVG
jgi:SAM-dependent methyltransferase